MENLGTTNTAIEKLNTDDPVDYSGFDTKNLLQVMLDNLEVIKNNEELIIHTQGLVDSNDGEATTWWTEEWERDIATAEKTIQECKKHHNDMLRFLKPL